MPDDSKFNYSSNRNEAQKFFGQMYGQARGLPIIGKHLGRIGRILDIWASPCAPDPYLFLSYIASAPDAIGFAVATLFKPQETDYMASRLVGTHRRGQNLTGKYRRPEIDMYKNLATLTQFTKFRSSNGTEAGMITGIQLGRLAGWYLAVAEATTAGLLRWVSAAYTMAGCVVPPVKRLSAYIPEGTVIAFPNAWFPLTPWVTTQQIGFPPGFHFTGSMAPGNGLEWNVMFTATADKPNPTWPDTTYEFRLRWISEGKEHYSTPTETFTATNADGSQSTAIRLYWGYLAQNASGVACQYRMTGSGFGIIKSARFEFDAVENPNVMKPDP